MPYGQLLKKIAMDPGYIAELVVMHRLMKLTGCCEQKSVYICNVVRLQCNFSWACNVVIFDVM